MWLSQMIVLLPILPHYHVYYDFVVLFPQREAI